MKTDPYGVGAGILTTIMWGLAGIFVRLLPPFSPFIVTAGRLLFALAIALPLVWMFRRDRVSFKGCLYNKHAWRLSLLLAGYYFLATTAFQLSSVAEVALLLSTSPLFVLMYRRLSGESIRFAEHAGAIMAVGGIGLVMLPSLDAGHGISPARLAGDGLSLLAAAFVGRYATLYRGLNADHAAPDPTGVGVMTFAVGGIAVAIGAFITGAHMETPLWDARVLLLFAGFGILSTALPTVSYAIASRRLPPLTTTTIALLMPLFATLFAFLILKEAPSPLLLPGSLLVLGGLVIILRSGR